MSKLDWSELILRAKDEAAKVGVNSDEWFDKYRATLEIFSKSDMLTLLHYVTIDNEKELNIYAWALLARNMSDEELLKARQGSIESAQVWAAIERQKRALCDGLLSAAGKVIANILVKAILIGIAVV